jgi:fatty acid desaturase
MTGLPSAAMLLPVLPVSWMFTVGAARKLHTTVMHYCVHDNFLRSKLVDRIVGEVISTIIMVQPFDAYQGDHKNTHHTKHLATLDDPDVKFLMRCGFRPGQSKGFYWQQFWRTCLSPSFHCFFLFVRLRPNFWEAETPLYRRAMSFIWHSALLAAVAATCYAQANLLPALLFMGAWVLPLTALMHLSALAQFSSEHRWMAVYSSDFNETGKPYKVLLARLTSGRFCGECVPSAGLSGIARLKAWIVWTARMIFIHAPTRIFVLTGSLCTHDFHHRKAMHPDWGNEFYARQRDVEAGAPGWEAYTEIWGLSNAIDAVFDVFAGLPPLPETTVPMTVAEMEEVLRSM